MWASKDDVMKCQHDKAFLDMWEKEVGKPYKHPVVEVDELTNIPVICYGGFMLSTHFENLEEIYYPLGMIEGEIFPLDSWTLMEKCLGGTIPAYGNSDLAKTDKEVVSTLIEWYPELKRLADCKKNKYLIVLTGATDDFRFHKNGGYRGKDQVWEHVKDSPADIYLNFHVVKIKEK